MGSRKCNACAKVLRGMDFMECSDYHEVYDFPCLGIKKQEFTKYTSTFKSQWTCPACKTMQPKTDNSNTPLRNLTTGIITDSISENVNAIRGNQLHQSKRAEDEEITLTFIAHEMRRLRDDMSELKDQINVISNRIACIEEIEKKSIERDSETANLKLHINTLQETIDMQAQQLVRNELEIIGIPETNQENLFHFTAVVSKLAGMDVMETDIDDVYRAGKHREQSNSGDTQTRPIVVRFLRKVKKDQLLKAAKVRKNLTTAEIVRGTPKTIYINERLTAKNRLLFRETRLRCRAHGFRFCWIKDGTIYARKAEKKAAIRIRSEIDLDEKIGPSATPSLSASDNKTME